MSATKPSILSRRTVLRSAGLMLGAGGAAITGVRGGLASSVYSPPMLNFRTAQGSATLEFWGQFPEALAPFERVMADFNAAHPEVTVQVVMAPNDQYKPKLQSALNTGAGPDMYMVPALPELKSYVDANNLLDVTDEVDMSPILAVAQEAVTVDDRVWGVPSGRYTVGIGYHRNLFEDAGITAEPTTWAEMRDAMAALLEAGITPYSIAAKDGSLTYFNYIGLAFTVLGTEGFADVLTGERKLNTPDLVTVVQEMKDWAPYYQPNFLGTPYAEAKALFGTGRTAMMDIGSADLSGLYEIDPDAQLGFFYWPAPEGGTQVTNTGMSVIYGINPATEQQEAALTFVRWVATPEGAISMNKNIKMLPVQDVPVEGDPILTKMVETPLDIPVWYERWPTLNIGQVWTTDGNAAFDADRPAQEFADLLQASVDTQLANAPE
jgi:raffinose/stachyose/melibiose transport system substrate-binding protein